jgi:hypothetical protein
VNVATNLTATAGTTSGPTINSSTGTSVVIPSASDTASGIVTTGAQTFAGVKTMTSPVLVTPSIGVATGISFNSITGLATTLPIVAGVAETGSSTEAAKADHIHPVQTSISGNAGTATKLETARTIGLSGDVTGSTSFDGSGNATITATVADDSHNHVISNVDGLQSALDGKVDNTKVVTTAITSVTFNADGTLTIVTP